MSVQAVEPNVDVGALLAEASETDEEPRQGVAIDRGLAAEAAEQRLRTQAVDQPQPAMEPAVAKLLEPLGEVCHAAVCDGYGGGFLAFLITRSWVEGSQKLASSW